MSAKAKRKMPPKMEDMTEEQVKQFVKKKRQGEAQAQSIVMELLNESISMEVFVKHLPYITQAHYDDVIVERAITKVCGYPLCSNTIGENLPKQTYKICNKTNKVYDITTRKNFCSNQCYKSSDYIKDQISMSPLWFREKKDIPKFKLLPLDTKGAVGEVVDLSLTEKIKVVDKFTSLLEFTEASLTEMNLDDDKTQTEEPGQSSIPTKDVEIKKTTVEKKIEVKPKQKINKNILLNDVVEKKSENRMDPILKAGKDLVKSKETDNPLSCKVNKTISSDSNCSPTIIQIEKAMGEWFTFDTLLFLFGESKVKEMVADKNDAIKEYLSNLSSGLSNSSASYDQYQKLYRKLNILELEDKKYDNQVISDQKALKPLPDYSCIKEESRILELKVRSYFKGDTSILKGGSIETVEVEKEDEFTMNVPLADKHAQYILRRKIVLNGLDRVLPDLLRALNLTAREISGDVRDLISTFNLQAHNITFKYFQWNFIAILIIKLLSIRGAKLKDRLDMPTAFKHLELILLSYELDSGYMDRLIWWLTDVDRLLEVDPVGILK